MTITQPEYFYISGPEKPLFIEKGLYSGLKDREGLASPLPLTLKISQEYTATGFLDALPHQFLRQLELKEIILNVHLKGKAILSFYILLENKKIYHCQDYQLTEGSNQVLLPHSLINDPNGRLIFFKIKALLDNTVILDWAYLSNKIPEYISRARRLTIVTRTLGDSAALIDQFNTLNSQYHEIKERYPHYFLPAFPSLVIYESDRASYIDAKSIIKEKSINFIVIKYNKFNLGGGGNMCVAVHEEYITRANRNQFIMIDSDTLIPFRTLYFSIATAAFQAKQKVSTATVPTILYSKQPNLILESGALFGRGNWKIASSKAAQPCIAPLFHNKQISSTDVQANISDSGYTDYPPFIYSIFTAASEEDKIHFLPIPFFLRGDDIEMGIHQQDNNIPCLVNGWLVVFQQPKHSLWHEFMAILHGCCLIISKVDSHIYSNSSIEIQGLKEYFTTRLNCHTHAMDLAGLNTYNQILDRIVKLLEWGDDNIVNDFHDPDFYMEMRSLNSSYSHSHFKTLEALKQRNEIDPKTMISLPFLYYETEMKNFIDKHGVLPDHIFLVNQSNKTANIISTKEVDASQVQEMRLNILKNLNIVLDNINILNQKCETIRSRENVMKTYLNRYSPKTKLTNKISKTNLNSKQ